MTSPLRDQIDEIKEIMDGVKKTFDKFEQDIQTLKQDLEAIKNKPKEYSAMDHILGKPRADKIKEQNKRIDKKRKRILENTEKLQAAAKISEEEFIRVLREI